MKVDIKTAQKILRHQNSKTTLEIYANATSEDKLEAQGLFLEKLFSQDQRKRAPQEVGKIYSLLALPRGPTPTVER